MENNTLFVCDCNDVHHQMIVSFDPDPMFNDSIWFQIHLSDGNFITRLRYAIRYIFGQKSKYGNGAFSEILLNKEKTKKLIDLLNKHYGTMTEGTF